MKYNIDALRKKAEQLLENHEMRSNPDMVHDFEKVLEDYNIHKIELELQHEELEKNNVLLEKQNQKLDNLFENAPNGYLILDPEGRIIQSNQTAVNIFSVSKDLLEGKRFDQFIHPASQDKFHFHWIEVVQSKESRSVDIRLKKNDSRTQVFLINSVPYTEAEEEGWFVRLSLTDITAIKEAEALRDSERRYRMLFQNLVNGLLVLRPYVVNDQVKDFQFFRANSIFHEITGISKESVEGAPFIHLFPEVGIKILPLLYDTFDTSENLKLEGIELQTGYVVNVHTFTPEEGYVAIILEDVTGQKKAEDARLKSEQLLKSVFSILPVGVIITDQKGEIIDCNNATADLLGIKIVKGVVKNLKRNEWKIVRKDMSVLPFQELIGGKAIESNEIQVNEQIGIIKEKGEIRWINMSSVPVPSADIGVVNVYSDITEQVKAQEESEEKFRNIIQNSTDAIIIVNPKGYIIEWNKGCEIIYGVKKNDVIGMRIWKFLIQILADESALKNERLLLESKFLKTLKDGSDKWLEDISEMIIQPDGEEKKNIQSRIFPVKTSVGYLLGIITRDITGTKQAEKMLKIAKEEAEEASQAKSLFLANISHEIRTPLNAITGFTEILKEKKFDDSRVNAHLAGIEKSSKALVSLINDILDLSRSEAGKLEVHPVNVKLPALIKDVKQIFSLKTAEKGVEMNLVFDPELPQWVVLDEIRLRQILFNLVGNAVKFTKKGTIGIIVNKTNKNNSNSLVDIEIEVIDTGVGINKKSLNNIFEPFFQSSPSGYPKQEGTGLGLAITKRFVELMKGKITVQSKPGEGTRFSVLLPNTRVTPENEVNKLENKRKDVKQKQKQTNTNEGLSAKVFDEIVDKTGSANAARKFMNEKIWMEFDKVSDILGFDEVSGLARYLKDLADEYKLDSLALFGAELQQHSSAFNVVTLNKLITSFESLRQKN